ncbi:hypothetical protein [Halolamina sp. C58]|uniref:hypothetical protein n=1 Tax=Halolamina sp. C58 TaxID=3421640 RepID=UPI003EB95DD9
MFVGRIAWSGGDGREERSLGAAIAGAFAVLLAVGLGAEGVVYAWAHPAAVFELQLLGYLLSAALMGTGVGVWAVRRLDALRAGDFRDAL